MMWITSAGFGVAPHLLLSPVLSGKVLDDNTVRPGWLGLGVVVALVAACALLFRSLIHQVNKIDPSLPRGPDATEAPPEPVPAQPTPPPVEGDDDQH